MTENLVIGVFVGGRAVRFGGVPKGLLLAPDTNEPIVSRLARITRETLPTSEFVLVGDADAYASLGYESIVDDPTGVGPIGALVALLSHAHARGRHAIALAADLPFVSTELVLRVAEHAPGCDAVAPRIDGLWHPLFARYASEPALHAARAVLAEGQRALHRVFAKLGPRAGELPLDPGEAALLRDWDRPEDVAGP